MSTSTLLTELDEKVVHKLNDLIRINLDSEEGFIDTANKLESASYASLFRQIAEERSRQAAELQTLVETGGDRPETDGSFLGQAHRWWIAARDAVSSSKNYDVLAEAERGEDKILHLYEEVRQQTAGSSAQSIVDTHHGQVKARHDQVRDLRDKAKAAEDRD